MNRTEQEGGFYQNPLCLLAAPWPFSKILSVCFQHGVCRYLDIASGPEWTREGRGEAFEEARHVIGFTGGDVAQFIQNHKVAEQFITKWAESGRKTCFVRFRTDIHFSTVAGDITEREWRILAAIFSAVGDKPMVKLGWKQIQCRAAGWLTNPAIGDSHAPPSWGPCYPRGQIERSVGKLLGRGLLFAATYRKGERYWSHRLDQAGIWKEIEVRKLKAAARAGAERRRIDALQGAIVQAKVLGSPAPRPVLRAV